MISLFFVKRFSGLFIAFLLLSFFAGSVEAQGEKGKTGFVLSGPEGEVVYGHNPDTPLVPASVLKIATSLAAFHWLGDKFRFKTQFYLDQEGRRLYIKGLGDPLFVSEKIRDACAAVAKKLKKGGIPSLDGVFVDQSFFEKEIGIPGSGNSLNPYDVCQAALSANFNTLFFKRDKSGKCFVSAESQTPLLPLFYGKVAGTGLDSGRIALSKKESLIYAGLLPVYFLEKYGITVSGEVRQVKTPASAALFHVYTSDFSMRGVVKKLLKYSSNFMANQILLTMGAYVYGPPASLEKGVDALLAFLKADVGAQTIQIAEGSGISRKNRLSCRDMAKILVYFKPYAHLMKRAGNDFYKTGTLEGIRTRAGYLKARDGTLNPYVIMVNQENRGCREILEEIRARVD